VPLKDADVVVVAGQRVDRCSQRFEELAHLPVLGVGRVIGEIAGDEHGVRVLPQPPDCRDRRGDARDRIAVRPLGADVEVAQLHEQERRAHRDIIVQTQRMATMADLDRLALAMPATSKEVSDGRPTYLAHGKMFCFHRGPRKDAVDPATGERLEDVLAFRVDGLEAKELLLSDPRGIFFTTPHWNGYAAVLMRIPDLERIDEDELRDLVVEAWLTRAQKRIAKAWLAEHEPE
jgi:hypothetical protein